MIENPTLRGEDIVLRPTALEDAPGIAEAGRDPAIRAMPWFGDGFQDAWAEPWVGRAADEWAAGRNFVFSIIDPAGRYLGSVVAAVRDGAVEVAYWVLPDARKQGVATRAVRALLPWVRERFPQARVWAKTQPDNAASQRVLLGCGFVETGRKTLVYFDWRGEVGR